MTLSLKWHNLEFKIRNTTNFQINIRTLKQKKIWKVNLHSLAINSMYICKFHT